MTIYISLLLPPDNVLKPTDKPLLTSESFQLEKLDHIRDTLLREGSHLSREESIEIVTLQFPSALTEEYRRNFFIAGEDFWKTIKQIDFNKFKKKPVEMQRLEIFEKITPDLNNPALCRHFKKVVRESDPVENYKHWLKEHIRRQTWDDYSRFINIAANVFLDCIPKWEPLNTLAHSRTSEAHSCDPPSTTTTQQYTDHEDRNIFVKRGDFWSIEYAGQKLPPLKDALGMNYLAVLLREPNREFHVFELMQAVKGDEVLDQGDAGEILDRKARNDYRKELELLSREREAAEKNQDTAEITRINEDLEKISEYLESATGLAGRSRKAKSKLDNARSNIWSHVRKSAIGRISKHHAKLGLHLETSIQTGTYCVYRSDPTNPISWLTS